MPRRVLVTAALPYANGSPHLGHLLGYIQTDVHVRARRIAGEDVVFIWAVDTHGTPIELRARREGIAPADLVARMHAEHAQVYADFGIEPDIFYTTHSDETRRHAEGIYEAMRQFVRQREPPALKRERAVHDDDGKLGGAVILANQAGES